MHSTSSSWRRSGRAAIVLTLFALALLGSSAIAFAKSPAAAPVEADRGVGGEVVLPVEPDGGIGDTPMPVEPDGGIGD